MKISAFNGSYEQKNLAFGVGLGNTVSGIISTARFDSFRTKNPKRILSTMNKIDALKKMKDNYVLTAFLDTIKSTTECKDVYCFYMTPKSYSQNHSEFLKKIPADTPPLIILTKLVQAVKKFPEQVINKL